MSTALTVEKVRAALVAGDHSPSRAAEILGVSRVTVWRWMKRHNIRVAKELSA